MLCPNVAMILVCYKTVLTLLTLEPDQSGSRSRLHCNRQMAPQIEFPLGDDCSQYIY